MEWIRYIHIYICIYIYDICMDIIIYICIHNICNASQFNNMDLLYIIGKYQSLYEFNVDLIGKYPAIFIGFHQQKRLTQTKGCPIISKSSQKKWFFKQK